MHRFFYSLICLVMALAGCSRDSADPVLATGVEATSVLHLLAGQGQVMTLYLADREYLNLDGSAVNMASVHGRPVLVNYWATWCAPCVRELPSLLAAAEAMENEVSFMLASDEDEQQIRNFLEEQGLDDRLFVRLEGSFSQNNIHAVPSTTLYGTDGSQIGNWLGDYEWDSPSILSELRTLVERGESR